MAFAPEKFLHLIDHEVLKEFLAIFGIKTTKELLKNTKELYKSIQKNQRFADIESQLREIKEMSNQDSMATMLDFAKDLGVEIEEINDLENNQSRAMWIFVKHKDIFENTYLWDHLDSWGSEYRVENKANLKPSFFTKEKLDSLKIKLKAHFEKEKKARHCEVEMSINPSTENFCIYAHFDDHSHAELGIKEGQISKVSRRPIKEIYFLIIPEKGKIALQFKRARSKRKKDLIRLFVEGILEEEFDEESMNTLNLAPLTKESFKLNIPPEDGLEFYRIKNLRLDKKIGSNRHRIILDVKDGHKKEDIYNLIQSLSINTELFFVTQAVIHFQFSDAGRRGSITITLTNPNNDNIKDTPLHQKCRKYLTEAGIIT